jgi:hypothetical protein
LKAIGVDIEDLGKTHGEVTIVALLDCVEIAKPIRKSTEPAAFKLAALFCLRIEVGNNLDSNIELVVSVRIRRVPSVVDSSSPSIVVHTVGS